MRVHPKIHLKMDPKMSPNKLIAQLIPRQQQINKNKNLHTSAFFCTFAGKFGYNYNFWR